MAITAQYSHHLFTACAEAALYLETTIPTADLTLVMCSVNPAPWTRPSCAEHTAYSYSARIYCPLCNRFPPAAVSERAQLKLGLLSRNCSVLCFVPFFC